MKGWIEDFKEWKKRETEAIDDQACIKVSELREWLNIRINEETEHLKIYGKDLELAKESSSWDVREELQELLTKFCGGK